MLRGSSRPRRLLTATLSILVSLPLATPFAATGEGGPEPPRPDPPIRLDYHEQTGKLTFLGASPQSPVVIQGALAAGLAPEGRARAAVEVYGPAFGLRDPFAELELLGLRSAERGRTSARYHQVFRGVPVLGGEIIVNQDSLGRLLSMSGEISPDLSLSVDPGVTAQDAAALAIAVTAKAHQLDPAELVVSSPELWVYDERLLLPSSRPAELVWRMDVSGRQALDVNELVLVSARTGGISLHFNQIDAALYREIYDNNNNPAAGLPGTGPVRTEGGGATGITDVDKAYDYAGDTYSFYFNHHGRDSLDDAGMGLISTVRYCDPFDVCPYSNAFWTGAPEYQMVYGEGFASGDDVVGHELTHGVTNFESSLFYYYQSGAINESFSDVWGEFIDLENGVGDDSAGVRWLMGEDIPIGAIRSMKTPPTYGDPDRMSSANYWTASSDNGGVHSNSGINNKAVYLMTDGASFNGFDVTGLGIAKVAAIYYDVQTTMLTSGSDYGDLYNALYQSCLDLVGGTEGITLGDCTEVREATDAVEMDEEPQPNFNPEAEVCPAGTTKTDLFYDDIESGLANWTAAAMEGLSSWFLTAGYAHGGDYSLYGADYLADVPTDSYVAMDSDVLLPVGSMPYLWFAHAFGFDAPDFDGGWVEYSTDGGGAWLDAGSLIDSGLAYTGSLNSLSNNPNPGHVAYVGASHGYVSTRVDLSSLAGQSVRFRWRMSQDDIVSDLGWLVDDVGIYTCDFIPTDTPSPTPSNTPLPTGTDTPTPTPSDTPLPTATDTPSATPSATPLPTATDTPTPTPSDTPLPTATDTPTPTPSDTPLPTATDTPTPTPSDTPPPAATDTSTPTITPTPQPGDLNLDGAINVLDIQLCVNVFLGVETDPAIVDRSDLNGDGAVNVLDVQLLVNLFLAG